MGRRYYYDRNGRFIGSSSRTKPKNPWVDRFWFLMMLIGISLFGMCVQGLAG